MLHSFNKTEQMKHPKLRAELRTNEQWFFITLILTTNKTFYRFHRNVKMTKDVQPMQEIQAVIEIHRNVKKCRQSAVLAYIPGKISHQRFIQSMWLD